MSSPPSPPSFIFGSPSPSPSPSSGGEIVNLPPPSAPSPPQHGPRRLPSPTNPSDGEIPPSRPSPSSGGSSTVVVVGIVFGGVSVLVILSLVWFLCKKKRRRDHEAPPAPQVGGPYHGQQQHNASRPSDHKVTSMPPYAPPRPPAFMSSSSIGSDSNYSDHNSALPPPSPGLGFNQNSFTYEELSRATNGFSEANLLGQGGFGYVFKGILHNGKEVAVKQLKAGSAQGEREFQAEVEIISRVHHRHLVTLVGYCISDAQRLLVYEFIPNNTLDFHLHGKGQPPMEWNSRLKIAVGSAKALSYLHEHCNPKIIHRDIKAANILIDLKFEAKVADFGLAKIVSDTNTHVSTRIMGTFGYLAPEYAASGKLTEKSDVYSFGVILLELITGRRPFDSNNGFQDDNLVDWALPLLNEAYEDRDFEVLADTKMDDEYDIEEMARMVACAAACVRHLARHRPSMDQVVRVLDGKASPSELKEGIKPVKSMLTDYDTSQYSEDMKKIRKVALGSLSYNTSSEYSNPTSEYSNPTSDFGMHSSGSTTREMEIDLSL